MNAAGCGCTTAAELDSLFASSSDAVVSKTCTLKARLGNDRPRIYLATDGTGNSLNSVGLANPGLQYYLEYSKTIQSSKPFILSFHPFTPEELEQALKLISQTTKEHKISMIEINLSCPNLSTDRLLFEHVDSFLQVIGSHKANLPAVGIKLWPMLARSEISNMAHLLKSYADVLSFITLCNTLPNGLMIDAQRRETRIRPNDGLGGIGGPICKPFALANVWQFSQLLQGSGIKIIGCGGICTTNDILEYQLCGADAVQIGTFLIREGPGCFRVLKSSQLVAVSSLSLPSKL